MFALVSSEGGEELGVGGGIKRRRERKQKSQTALINVARSTSVAAETISLHHSFKLPRNETWEGGPNPTAI